MTTQRKELPAEKRRFDSIAWLIQGDATCGASYFDGHTLWLATNENKRSELVKVIIKHLKNVAEAYAKLQGKFDDKKLNEIKLEVSKLCDKVKNYASSSKDCTLYNNPQYKAAFNRALTKVTRSIKNSYIAPAHKKAFSQKLRKAIEENRIIFLEGSYTKQRTDREVHAELKIVHNCINKGLFKDSHCHIGVSKTCCGNCTNTIKAVNNSRKLKLSDNDKHAEIPQITVSGHHEEPFPAAIPAFLETQEDIKKEFLRLTKKKDLEEAFNSTPKKGKFDKTIQLQQASESTEDSSVSEKNEKKKNVKVATSGSTTVQKTAVSNPSQSALTRVSNTPQQVSSPVSLLSAETSLNTAAKKESAEKKTHQAWSKESGTAKLAQPSNANPLSNRATNSLPNHDSRPSASFFNQPANPSSNPSLKNPSKPKPDTKKTEAKSNFSQSGS
jgi:hypothetical protein